MFKITNHSILNKELSVLNKNTKNKLEKKLYLSKKSMKLSDKLFLTRVEKKLSKQEVANRLNMDVTTYGRVESGKRSLEIDKLKLLPEALGIEAKEILDLLDIDKGNVFNINNEEYASGNGYVENYYMENRESLIEIKRLYQEIIKQKDDTIKILQKENETLKALLK